MVICVLGMDMWVGTIAIFEHTQSLRSWKFNVSAVWAYFRYQDYLFKDRLLDDDYGNCGVEYQPHPNSNMF